MVVGEGWGGGVRVGMGVGGKEGGCVGGGWVDD